MVINTGIATIDGVSRPDLKRLDSIKVINQIRILIGETSGRREFNRFIAI